LIAIDHWDTGDLLGRIQPEEIIPYQEPLNMKAGWENIIYLSQNLNRKKRRRGKVGGSDVWNGLFVFMI